MPYTIAHEADGNNNRPDFEKREMWMLRETLETERSGSSVSHRGHTRIPRATTISRIRVEEIYCVVAGSVDVTFDDHRESLE